MSGGGKGITAPANSEAIVGSKPAYLKNAAPAVQSAGMPGQLAAMAQQLGAGFGQTPAAMMAELQRVYQPAPTMNFNGPPVAPKVVPKPKPKPVTSPLNMAKPTAKVPSLGRNAR